MPLPLFRCNSPHFHAILGRNRAFRSKATPKQPSLARNSPKLTGHLASIEVGGHVRVFSLVIALSMAVPSAGSTQSMSKGASLPGGEAIGRLMVAGRSMCTGALVASDLVLTAAHCLYSPKTGRKVDPRKIEFQAGLRSGKAKATRTVKNTVQHPKYRHNVGNAQVGYDLALLKLRKPIPANIAKPVAISTGRSSEGLLGVVSYTIGNQNDPRMMFPCQVLARQNETMVMNCKVISMSFWVVRCSIRCVKTMQIPLSVGSPSPDCWWSFSLVEAWVFICCPAWSTPWND